MNKEQLENMLEDVVNELDLSAEMIEKHGQLGTAPSELVKLVLMEKDLRIRMLSMNMKEVIGNIHQNKELIKEQQQ